MKQRKKKKAAGTRLPIPRPEMKVLETLARAPSRQTAEDLAEMTDLNPPSIYVLLQRLRTRGMVETHHEWRRNDDGIRRKFAMNSLTDDGVRFIVNWQTFVQALGPKLRHSLRC